MNEPNSFDRFSRTDDVRANLKQKSIRGAVFMASGNAADILVRFGSIAILARLLVPEDFGLIAMVMALTSILDGFRDFGLSAATVQRPDINHWQITNLFWLNVAVGVILASIVATAAPLIAAFYQESRLVDISVALSLVFVWNGLTVQHEALLIRQLRQGELALIRLAASFISVIIAVGLAMNDWGYWSLVWREIARSALITGGVWIRCLWIPGLPHRRVGTRSLVRFGSEISLTHFLTSLIMHVDKLLVGRLFGAAAVGIYRQAQQLILAPIDQLNQPINGVAQPGLSALQRDPVRYRRFYEKIVFIVAALTIPLGLFIAVCAEEITLLMLGPNWTDATVFVRIFGVGAAIRPAIGTSAIVLITCGKSTLYLAVSIVHAVCLTLSLLAAIPWGAVGIAIAYVGTTLVLMYPKLHFSFVDTPASVAGFFSALLAPCVSAFVMLCALLMVRNLAPTNGEVESLALSIGVGGAVYLASMWLQPGGRVEIKSLLRDIRTVLNARQR
jgi:PST family polysaccharide transporter